MDIGYREPTAKELVQRHNITSTAACGNSPTPASPLSTNQRPPLSVLRRGMSVVPSSLDRQLSIAIGSSINRETVYTMHQQPRSALLYGKNNVVVMPKDGGSPLKGYLSLHQDPHSSLILKWTPNLLMMQQQQQSGTQSSATASPSKRPTRQLDNELRLWKYAVSVRMDRITYIHLHQQPQEQEQESTASVVLVDTEGLQHSHFRFEAFAHCLTFLNCLENGLLPSGYKLDPPLEKDSKGRGKVLPKMIKRWTSKEQQEEGEPEKEGEDADKPIEYVKDYVFRVIHSFGLGSASPSANMMMEQQHSRFINPAAASVVSRRRSSEVESMLSMSESPRQGPDSPQLPKGDQTPDGIVRSSLLSACHTMRSQILSRAFYGWLAYVRHLKTIRAHLASVVQGYPIDEDEWDTPVNDEFWRLARSEKTIALYKQLLIRVYLHGVESHLRPKVWPYLLRLIDWHEEIEEKIDAIKSKYNKDVVEWSEIEAEVKKADEEAFKAARLRQSSCNGDVNSPPLLRDHCTSTSSDVFEETQQSRGDPLNGVSLVDDFGSNLHRIEKDVERCDRNTLFFSNSPEGEENLKRLRRLMCTYVWRQLGDGYVQGMCDLAGPLMVIFNDEVMACACFEKLMARMRINFPQSSSLHGNGIEQNLSNLRSMVQVMDPDLFYALLNGSDYTNLYFAYRWLLLDFKRELTYPETFKVWEVIWAAEKTVSNSFQLFFALALLTQYREVLLENSMDYTDALKFFNEMAEKHNVEELLMIARRKLKGLQEIVLDLNR